MQSHFQNNSISLLYFHKSLKYDTLNTNQKPHIYQFYVYLLMFLTESLLCPLCPLDPEGRRHRKTVMVMRSDSVSPPVNTKCSMSKSSSLNSPQNFSCPSVDELRTFSGCPSFKPEGKT